MSNENIPGSFLNEAVEAVMDLIDGLGNFALISRGALGSGNGISCEIGPSSPEAVFLSKEFYIPLDLTLNARHSDLRILSDTMNRIHDQLTRARSYPEGDGWEIVDITNGTLPQIVGREDNNDWMMASSLTVRIYRKDENE